jgi:hypothetical protein
MTLKFSTRSSADFLSLGLRISPIAWLLTFLALSSLAEGTEPFFIDGRADLSFGHRQLEQVLADRPDMRKTLPDEYTIQWIIDSFNGDMFGSRVYWIADAPEGGFPSIYYSPQRAAPAMIRVSADPGITPLDKWAALIFEFHNLSGSKEFIAASDLAYSGRITGEEYAIACVELEYQAMRRAKQFFKKHPLPQGDNSEDQLYARLLHVPSSFEEYQATFAATNTPCGNYDHFKKHYDNTVVPAMIRAGRLR